VSGLEAAWAALAAGRDAEALALAEGCLDELMEAADGDPGALDADQVAAAVEALEVEGEVAIRLEDAADRREDSQAAVEDLVGLGEKFEALCLVVRGAASAEDWPTASTAYLALGSLAGEPRRGAHDDRRHRVLPALAAGRALIAQGATAAAREVLAPLGDDPEATTLLLALLANPTGGPAALS